MRVACPLPTFGGQYRDSENEYASLQEVLESLHHIADQGSKINMEVNAVDINYVNTRTIETTFLIGKVQSI